MFSTKIIGLKDYHYYIDILLYEHSHIMQMSEERIEIF